MYSANRPSEPSLLLLVLTFQTVLQFMLFFLPSMTGVRKGLRDLTLTLPQTSVLAAAIVVLTVLATWTGENDGDPTDPAGYGRPRTGCSDGDSGTNSDPAGRGRCRTGESDSDSSDAAGHGRPRTGISDSDSGPGADAAGRGRGRGECNDRDRGATGDPAGRGRRCVRRGR